MATIQEITQRIAAANAESKRLNNERNVNLGKKETLTTQLNNALAQYSSKYGVTLTVDNLQEEMARVLAEKEKETTTVETMLGLIKDGKYEEAERVANPNVAQVTNDEQIVESASPVENVAEKKVVESASKVENVANEKVVEPVSPLPNLTEEKVVEPVSPLPNLADELPNLSEEIKLPSLSDEIDKEKSSSNVELPNLSEDIKMDALSEFTSGEPMNPQNIKVTEKEESSTPPDLSGVTDFDAILGGTAFSMN